MRPSRRAYVVLGFPMGVAARLLTTVSGLLLAAGCGPGEIEIPCQPVSGYVLMKDQPVAEATVVFHPTGTTEQPGPKPIAYTDAEGYFELTTVKLGDGAPLGSYAITIELRDQRQVGEETVRDGPSLLPERYAKPESSGFSYTVVDGDNEVPPLLLVP